MKAARVSLRAFLRSDLALLVMLALARVAIQVITNTQFGFHRDELDTLDNARLLAWGYVAYPPVTPFFGRLSLELFGLSLTGARLFGVLAHGVSMVLVGDMARVMGGRRPAQVLAALAFALTPMSLALAHMLQYVNFDLLWWVLASYFVVHLLASDDPRWWLGVGAAIGLGAMTKYTVAFLVAGLLVGLLVSGARRWLASGWLWGGVALALLICLPNLIWQAQHHFVSLNFLTSIHARDVRIGRTSGFLFDQIKMTANPTTIALIACGLYFCLFARAGLRYRMLGWTFLGVLGLFVAAQARGYYILPAYPMLIAAGAYFADDWLAQPLDAQASRLARGLRGVGQWAISWSTLLTGGVVVMLLVLPFGPVNGPMWNIQSALNSEVREEIGWPELVDTLAGIYHSLPAAEQAHAGILAGNYGEAGAVNLFGPARGLPNAISGINSYWMRGYGTPPGGQPPEPVILVGFNQQFVDARFEDCRLVGHVTNKFGVLNEETREHPDIYLCRRPNVPWQEFWKAFQYFG